MSRIQRIMLWLFLAFCLPAVSQTTSTQPIQPVTAFGLVLGEAAPAECPLYKLGGDYDYKSSVPSACIRRIGLVKDKHGLLIRATPNPKLPPVANEVVEIAFPFEQRPNLTSDLYIRGRVVDGKLEEVSFNTLGLRDQDRIMDALKAKFGEATTVKQLPVQSTYGSLTGVDATWQLAGATCEYVSAMDRINRGMVVITTPKGEAAAKAAAEARSKSSNL